MRVLVAMDSFKGGLSSKQLADLAERGIRKVYPGAIVDKIAVADGGEGSVEAMAETMGGKLREVTVHGPVGECVTARYALAGTRAVIEMAAASGLCLMHGRQDVLGSSTIGTGELIFDAVENGCDQIIVCIGGSATTDGGMGALRALGVQFFDRDGAKLAGCGADLEQVASIDTSQVPAAVRQARISIACDVVNPLFGPKGAAYVFAPQKGANAEQVQRLDAGLRHYDELMRSHTGKDIASQPGMGAAGGLGYGLSQLLGAKLCRGADLILDEIGIDTHLSQCDIVITGEGRIDRQTPDGKLPAGIAKRAKKIGKTVFAICGSEERNVQEALYTAGIDEVISCVATPCTLQEAMEQAQDNVIRAAQRLMRIIEASCKIGGNIQ